MAAQLSLPQLALEAASASRLVRRNNDTLTSRLQTNDPTLVHLQLCRKPASLFGGDDMGSFLLALTQNKTVTSVELSWRFLSALSAVQRILLMEHLGALPFLEKMYMEAMGPSDALVAALEKTQRLKTFWIGALRLSSNADVEKLTVALSRNATLMQFNLNNIRLLKQGSYRVDNQGMVWFQENERNESTVKLDMNPLLRAVANIPAMKKIQLELQLNPGTMVRLNPGTLRSMFQPGRTFLMLSACDLDDEDVAVIAEESRQSTSLETLNLYRNNKVTEIGWRLLAEMLETNYSLTGLFTPLRGGTTVADHSPYQTDRFRQRSRMRNEGLGVYTATIPPSLECRAKMDLLLRLNARGRKQLLQDPDWVAFLTREIHDIDVCFYVLLAAPGLFVA